MNHKFHTTTTGRMMMGILDELRKAEAEAPPETLDRIRPAKGNWHPICVCGHQRKYHSTEIGGSYPAAEEDKTGVLNVLHGCCGETWGRGRETYERQLVDGRITVLRIATCACLKFQPVAEARDPRFRFRQRRPVIQGTTARDYAVIRHAFMTGIRATETSTRKLKLVLDFEGTERMREELIQQLLADRFRWIEGARVCATRNCTRTEDVWPVYVGGDQSELRCPEHRDR